MTTTQQQPPPYLNYYDLERYLFDEVSVRYQTSGTLAAFDFFCIVIWKANRAKSKVARRLLEHGDFPSLQDAVEALLQQVFNAPSSEQRLAVLMESWGFRLPMATAILTVLYPSEFTVYDVRVCNELRTFHSLKHASKPAAIWNGYRDYKAAVEAATPASLSLRDKDRWLWGRSFASQLQRDIEKAFNKGSAGADDDASHMNSPHGSKTGSL